MHPTIPLEHTHTHTRTHTHTHTQVLTHRSTVHPVWWRGAYGTGKWLQEKGKHGRSIAVEKERFWGWMWRSQERVLNFFLRTSILQWLCPADWLYGQPCHRLYNLSRRREFSGQHLCLTKLSGFVASRLKPRTHHATQPFSSTARSPSLWHCSQPWLSVAVKNLLSPFELTQTQRTDLLIR